MSKLGIRFPTINERKKSKEENLKDILMTDIGKTLVFLLLMIGT